MGKNNCVYKVVVYIGSFESHERQVVYTTSKMSNAERFLHDYCDKHAEVSKAYIERSYGRDMKRNIKHMREYD